MASESTVFCPAQQHVLFSVIYSWNTEIEMIVKSSILESNLALNFWSEKDVKQKNPRDNKSVGYGLHHQLCTIVSVKRLMTATDTSQINTNIATEIEHFHRLFF